MTALVAALILLLPGQTQSESPRLTLVCDGVGNTTSRQSATVDAFTPNQRQVTVTGTERISERVMVSLAPGENRIRIPSTLLPPLRGRSDDGWRPLTDVTVDETTIRGRVNINLLNRPSVRIDRLTGSIELEGFASTRFSGQCEAVDPEARRF